MEQEYRHAIALMRYSVIAPLIPGLPEGYIIGKVFYTLIVYIPICKCFPKIYISVRNRFITKMMFYFSLKATTHIIYNAHITICLNPKDIIIIEFKAII